jgi:Ca2+-binding EF-hand superfamily protein
MVLENKRHQILLSILLRNLILTLIILDFIISFLSMQDLLMVKDFTGDGEINEEEFYRIMKKTSLF